MNEVLNQAKTCWVEVPLSTNFEEFTLPILFAPDDDFNDYFAAMDRLHKRQSRALGGMRQHCVRARRALSENRHGDAIVHLEDHWKARKQVFAAADYQVVAAEVHIVFTAQHFGALLLAEGKSDDAHVMLSVAAEKLRDVFHAEAATELRTAARPNDEGPARAARQRQRAVRMRALLLLSHNTASFWVRRGKWAAAQQHALRAAAVARDLAAPWLAPTCDATEAAPARALVALLDARAYVCLCNAPQPGIHHNKKLHELIHWLREDPEIVRMKTSTIVIPGLVQSSKVKQMRGGGRSDPWQLLSEQPMNVVACSSSGLRNCSADPWFIGATAEFVAVSALAVDCIKTRQFDTAEKFVAECRDILQDPSQPQPVNPHWHHLVDMYAVTAQQGRERDVAATFKMDPGCTRGAVPLATQRFVRRYVEGRRAEKHRQHIEEKWIHRKIAEDESGELEELPMSELRERFALPKTAVERALLSDGMAEHAALFESTKSLARKAQGQPVPSLWDHVTSLVERNKERSPRRTGSPRARARRNRGLNASGEGATAGGEGSPFDDCPPTGLESPLFHGADTEASLAPHSLGGENGDCGGRRPKQAEQSPRRPGSGRSSRGGSASPRTLGRETSRDFSGTYERDDNTAAFRSGARAKPTAGLASPRSNDSPNGSRPGSARDPTSSPRRSVTSQCSDRATKSSHFLHVASSPDTAAVVANPQDGARDSDGAILSGRGERSVGSDDGRPRSGQSTASRRERREVEGRLRPSFTAPGAAATLDTPAGDGNQPAVDQDQQHALGRDGNDDGNAAPQDHLGAPGSRPGSAVGSDNLHRPPSASILKRPTSGGPTASQSLMVADDHPEHSGNAGAESSSHPTRTSTPGEKKAKRDRSARGLSILSPPGQDPVSSTQDSSGTVGGGRRRLLSTFTGAPVDENSALHAEVREVLAIDHRGLAARQQVLRATLPTLNPKEQTYRDIVHELSKNETALAKRRQVLARQKLMRRADAIAARAGCSQTWAELSKQRDRQRKSTAATLLAASQSNKEAATMLALSGSHGPGAPMEPSHRKTSSVHTPTQDDAIDAPQTGHPSKTQPAATTSPTAQIAAKTVTRQKKANATYASPSRQSGKSDPVAKSSKKMKGGASKAAKEAPQPRAATADPYHSENQTIAMDSGDGGEVGPGRASMLPPVRSATPPAGAPHGGVGDLDGDVRGWMEDGVSAEEQKRLLMLAKYGGTPPVKKK